jgi:hypothetical protein
MRYNQFVQWFQVKGKEKYDDPADTVEKKGEAKMFSFESLKAASSARGFKVIQEKATVWE